MEPTPIPAAETHGERVIRVAPPPGREHSIAPLEVVLAHDSNEDVYLLARVAVSPAEAVRLGAGEPFWITFVGGAIVPFSVGMHDPCPYGSSRDAQPHVPAPMEGSPFYCATCGGALLPEGAAAEEGEGLLLLAELLERVELGESTVPGEDRELLQRVRSYLGKDSS